MVVLNSDRLILKALSEEDIPALYSYFSNESNFPFVQMIVYKTLEDVKDYLLRMQAGIAAGKWYLWGIYLNTDSTLIGTISLWNFSEDRLTAEFGYGLFPEFRGQGYMGEAIKTCMDFAFNDLQMKRLEAYTQKNNLPSIAVLEKLGYRYESSVIEEGEEMVIYAVVQ